MEKIKISVVITIYNTSPFLNDCLESVTNNTWRNLEIILVDDGSLDNSLDIARYWLLKDDRIKIITQPNSGVSAARNNGLNYSTGGAIHFCDGDDYIAKDFYELLCKSMIENDCDMITSSFYNERTGYLDRSNFLVHLGLLGRLSANEGWMKNAGSFLIKKEFLEKHQELRFDTAFKYGEDLIFITKALFYARKVSIVPDAIYYYRFNPESTTKANRTPERNAEIRRCQLLVGELLDDFAREKNIPDEIWQRHKKNNYKIQEKFCEDIVSEQDCAPQPAGKDCATASQTFCQQESALSRILRKFRNV